MNSHKKSTIFSAGLAIFSMLFGAGNVIYPLVSGGYAQDKYIYAIVGFLTSTIFFSLMGLIAMMLFEGNYTKFFSRLGKLPGFLIICLIMGLIGPLAAMPRIVCVAYGSIKNILPQIPLVYFSIATCLSIFFFTFKKKRILDVLGYVLTPMLLGSLLLIIVVGLYKISTLDPSSYMTSTVIKKGFTDGYQTMDLLATLIFSSMVFNLLKAKTSNETDHKKLLSITLKASSIGLILLALTYICFIRLSAFYGPALAHLTSSEILNTLAVIVLGSKASILTSIVIMLACITTAIALTNVFTEFLYEKIFKQKVKYLYCLIGTLLVTFLFSTLNFDGITRILNPILVVFYPALIVLSGLNILNKLYGFKMVKTPVLITLCISLFFKIFA